MNRNDIHLMLNYHYWAHRRVWGCIEKLSDEQFEHDLAYSIGSLRRQCIHTLLVERFWLDIVRSHDLMQESPVYHHSHLTNRQAIWQAWEEQEKDTYAALDSFSNDQLDELVHYNFPFSGVQSHPRWQGFFYLVTHAVDHRAQILAGIDCLGGETVMQDFIRYVWGKD